MNFFTRVKSHTWKLDGRHVSRVAIMNAMSDGAVIYVRTNITGPKWSLRLTHSYRTRA